MGIDHREARRFDRSCLGDQNRVGLVVSQVHRYLLSATFLVHTGTVLALRGFVVCAASIKRPASEKMDEPVNIVCLLPNWTIKLPNN